MNFKPSPVSRSVLVALLLCLPGSSVWARGDAGASVVPRETEVAAPAPALADQIDALLTIRFEALDAVGVGDARRRALQDLSQFAAFTVEGLIEASPSAEIRALMDARLRPILSRHQRNIDLALSALGEQAQSSYPPSGVDFPRVANAP